MPGLLARLGSWGKGIISTAIQTGRTIAQVVGFAKEIAPEITPAAVESEWGHVSRSEQAEALVLDLPDNEYVPDRLHSTTDIPFKRPYAYTVSIYGRELATGRFARQDYDLPASRKLTISEIKDMARQRIGKKGTTEIIDIFNMEVSNAWIREL